MRNLLTKHRSIFLTLSLFSRKGTLGEKETHETSFFLLILFLFWKEKYREVASIFREGMTPWTSVHHHSIYSSKWAQMSGLPRYPILWLTPKERSTGLMPWLLSVLVLVYKDAQFPILPQRKPVLGKPLYTHYEPIPLPSNRSHTNPLWWFITHPLWVRKTFS